MIERMQFASPWFFLLLALIPAFLWYHRQSRRGHGAIGFPSLQNAARSGVSLRQRLSGVPVWLRAVAMTLLVVALARPRQGLERIRDVNKGIAIAMVIDRSGSMGAEMMVNRERVTRLEAVKRVFRNFVLGDGDELPGRANDLIGMIAFARYADTVCPLTLAHAALPKFLDTVDLVKQRSEDGTSIGDAVALAAARLKTAEETLAAQAPDADGEKEYEIKSKIIILLTDGENNSGKRSPLQAAELAAEWGIRLYTIGVGDDESANTVQPLFGPHRFRLGGGMDEGTLKRMADMTGGIYRRANSAEALQSVYKEIDQLERSEIESIRYVDYRERFVPFALAGFALLCLETLLRCTVFRRIP